MLDISRCQIDATVPAPWDSGVSEVREGQCLVAVYNSKGELTVKPSTGGAGEIFAGVALARITDVETEAVFESFTIEGNDGADDDFTLSHAPVTGSLGVWRGSTALTAGAIADGTFVLSGSTVTVRKTVNADETINVIYRRAITFKEGRRKQGDTWPGPHVTEDLRQVELITSGIVYTDEYVTTGSNWRADPTGIGLGADGRFDVVAAANSVASLILQHPRTNGDFLGFQF